MFYYCREATLYSMCSGHKVDGDCLLYSYEGTITVDMGGILYQLPFLFLARHVCFTIILCDKSIGMASLTDINPNDLHAFPLVLPRC